MDERTKIKDMSSVTICEDVEELRMKVKELENKVEELQKAVQELQKKLSKHIIRDLL